MSKRRANTRFAPTPRMAAAFVAIVGAHMWVHGGQGGPEGRPMAGDGDQAATGFEVIGTDTRKGVVHCRVRTAYQANETLVRMLVPKRLAPQAKRRVLFVLPVEPGTRSRFGDGLATVRKLNVADRFGFVIVAPTFSDWPWYCDHPTDPGLRQESYMLQVVVPLVTKLYPHGPRRRALLGFSKSGWGAFSLLLRHPDAFGAACAWDAPLMARKPRFGMTPIVGTLENFERYRVSRLLEQCAESVRGATRLAHFGYGNFRDHHHKAHVLMRRLGIPHRYADGPPRKHHWDGGWVEPAVRWLDEMLKEAERPSD